MGKRGFKRGILRHPELINAEGEGGHVRGGAGGRGHGVVKRGFKRGILRHPELINAEGEGGGLGSQKGNSRIPIPHAVAL